MKNIVKLFFSFAVWLTLACLAATQLQTKYHIHPLVTIVSLIVITLMVQKLSRNRDNDPNIFAADVATGIDVNIWAREIIKRLWKDNRFLAYAQNDNQYVLGGAVVLIPQPGSRPNTVKNRSSFPATAVRRTDSVISYVLNEYSTDPTHVTLNELATISYDKMGSVIEDLFGYLLQDVADDMIVNWAQAIPGSNLITTTGPATAALELGQTGNRLGLVWQNLRDAARVMNKQNVSKEGRVALLEENCFQQLVDSVSATPYKDFAKIMDEKEGTLGRLFGFDIMTRSSVAMAANALSGGNLAVNAFNAAAGATDNVVNLCWQRGVVANATGTVNLFNRAKDPLYYGDINSTSIRAGGRVRRADNAGIIAIVQQAA